MKEYIVPLYDTETDWDEVFVGAIREQEELIRCKDCKHWQFFDAVKANVCKRRYDQHYWQSHEDDY